MTYDIQDPQLSSKLAPITAKTALGVVEYVEILVSESLFVPLDRSTWMLFEIGDEVFLTFVRKPFDPLFAINNDESPRLPIS